MDHQGKLLADAGICLLSLDGSETGTTELSELVLLQELMQMIEHDAKLGRTPLPWEYFDLIGGTGMGGVFALLFAVWRLSVDDAIKIYVSLHDEVFSSEAWSNRDIKASSTLFDSTFRKIAASLGKSADESLVSESADVCKAFVCTVNPVNMKLPRLFCTYKARSIRSPDCSVAEAVVVSVAGHPHIKPVTLGYPPEQFISAVHRINNPSFEALREAQDIFRQSQDVFVACVVSIGAGQQEPLASDSGEVVGMGLFERIARDTDTIDQELERRFGGVKGLFCRLNVMHGLERNAQASESLSAITTHTKHYLGLEPVRRKLDVLVENLVGRPKKVTLAQMNSVVGPDAHDFTRSIKLHNALDQLPYANGASYNSEAGCMEGTRVDLLSRIYIWIDSAPNSPSAEMLLLSAVAGAGKSAVAHTVAKTADGRGFLASSFFFQRGFQDRDSPRAMLSTVIRDLAGRNQRFGDAIGAAIDEDRSLASANLQRQFEKLLLPCAHALSGKRPVLIVIDALDEVSDQVELRQLLNILRSRISALPSNLRILVTTRVVDSIGRALNETIPHIRTEAIDTQNPTNKDDLALFVGTSLCEVSEEHSLSEWPDPEVTRKLAFKAEGLFIWASVVVNLLKFDAFNPVDTLLSILENTKMGLIPNAKMDEMYAKALEVCGKWADPSFHRSYVAVIGTIVTAQTPLSLSAMQSLYRQDDKLNKTFSSILKALRPLLVGYKPDGRDDPIQVVHLSFKEFITGKSQSSILRDQYHISLASQHERMAACCLRVLNDDLNEFTPGVGLLDLKEEGIPLFDFSQVSEALLYASHHFKSHLMEITETFPDNICRALTDFTPLSRLRMWIEFAACSSSFQKVQDLAVLITLRVPGHGVFLGDIQSQDCARVLSRLDDRLKYMNRLEEALSATEDVVGIYKSLTHSREEFKPNLASSLRNSSVRLGDLGRREGALNAIEEAVDIYRSLAAARPEAFNRNLAVSLNSLSIHLSNLGRREEALKAVEESVDMCRILAAARPEAFNPKLAESLNNLSGYLGWLGRREEALKAIEEAVDIYRSLAAALPEAFNPNLAVSLNSLSVDLDNLGRREEALKAIEEAVDIHRSLAGPEAFNPDLAMSLNSLSVDLGKLGRREEALKAIEEAVNIHRQLAAARPEAFNSDLASSLNSLSNCFGDLGRREEALKAIEEAVDIRRQLAAARPEAFNPKLANSLNNLSNRLGDLGRREEALKAIEEGADIYRSLAAARPEAFNSDLAMSLNSLSVDLGNLGRREEALKAIEEAVDIRRSLAAARPEAFNPNLAVSLNNLSYRLGDLGRREEALKAIEEAVDINRSLAAARPEAFNPNLAVSLNSLSVDLGNLGRREEALKAIEEAVDIRRQLAAARPEVFNPKLADSLTNLSSCLGDLGRREEALKAIEEAVDIYLFLAAARPEAFNPDLAMSLNNLSNRLGDLGRLEEALKAIEEAIDIYRPLANARPEELNPDLAMSLNNLSSRLGDLGRREEALKAIEEAVDIRRQLAAARPEAFNPKLASSLNNLSSRLGDLGRREEALKAIVEAADIYRFLAAARPEAFNPDLAVSLNNLSSRLEELGMREEALKVIEEAVDIRRSLAAARPAAFNPDLAMSLYNLSLCLTDLGRLDEALMAIEEAVGIYWTLSTSLPTVFSENLARVLNQNSDCLRELGRGEEADAIA